MTMSADELLAVAFICGRVAPIGNTEQQSISALVAKGLLVRRANAYVLTPEGHRRMMQPHRDTTEDDP